MSNARLGAIGVIPSAVGGSPRLRRIFRRLPSAHRCKQCFAPFRGAFAIPFQLIWIRPSRKNPNLCTI